MMKPVSYRFLVTCVIFSFLAIGILILHSSGKLEFNNRYDPLPQTIHSVTLADEYDFAGESLPMNNDDVRERLERELLVNTYHHSSTILNLKLSMRYFPLFEEIFAQEGVPDDMKFLAVAESSLRNVASPAGAKGFWQFRDETARDYDMEVNNYIDERNNLEKSTHAACQYLKHQKEVFGSWTLAAAAYNMGPSALSKAISEQKENSYYDLNISDETNRYVFRIIALKEIMKNPEKFGFYIAKNEMYSPLTQLKTVTIDTGIPNLADFAHLMNMTYRQLKIYNPWLLRTDLPNPKHRVYSIKVVN